MSIIRREIERYMTGAAVDGSTVTAQFRFPPEFAGFQGHFPGKKVLPGVCEVQCALTAIERGRGGRAALGEIVLAKYFSPVLPDEELTCECREVADSNGPFLCRVMITKDTGKVAELKLRVVLSGSTKTG